MNPVLQEYQNTMVIIKHINILFIKAIIILLLFYLPLSAKNGSDYQTRSNEVAFLNFTFGDYYIDVKEKRNHSIDMGELTWYRLSLIHISEPTRPY